MKTTETLELKNFSGIKHLKIELNGFNVFIGKQASGKSVTAKALYFFKMFPDYIKSFVWEANSYSEIELNLIKTFFNIFPATAIGNGPFSLTYISKNTVIKIEKTVNQPIQLLLQNKLRVFIETWLRKIKDAFQKKDFDRIRKIQSLDFIQEVSEFFYFSPQNFESIFIPSGRSYFSILQNSIYSFLSKDINIDPTLLEFARLYEIFKKHYPSFQSSFSNSDQMFNEMTSEILGAKYYSENQQDFLRHKDGRTTPLAVASSGQQEIFPLIVFLTVLWKSTIETPAIFIEEPEAHLFPRYQSIITELLIAAYNKRKNETKFVITTHSPYIITSLNNMILGKNTELLLRKKKKSLKKLYDEIPKELLISIDEVSVYSFDENTAVNIMDKEEQLINASLIDSVSEEIQDEFNWLLSLGE